MGLLTDRNQIHISQSIEHILKLSKEDEEENSVNLKQLETEAGPLVQALAKVNVYLKCLEITLEEYVLLKIIIMCSPESEFLNGLTNDLTIIKHVHDTHLSALATLCSMERNRLEQLLNSIYIIEEAANILIESKMFYVPFLLTTNLP